MCAAGGVFLGHWFASQAVLVFGQNTCVVHVGVKLKPLTLIPTSFGARWREMARDGARWREMARGRDFFGEPSWCHARAFRLATH